MCARRYFGTVTRQLVRVLSKQIIKPSSPTPSHLKRFNLSSIDQLMTDSLIPFIFFFPNNHYTNPSKTADMVRLKQSLSKTLAQYYPFAGRLTSGTYVDCNDEGIEFQEARIETKLSEILKKKEDQNLTFPQSLVEKDFHHDSNLMVVRISHFDCGGIAMAVCLSHKVGDAITFTSFLKYWAALTTGQSPGELLAPYFVSHPPSSDPQSWQEPLAFKKDLVTKSFFFHNSKIAQLKTLVSSVVQNPTRIQVLLSLLYKCAMSASKSSSGSFSPSVLISAMNVRSIMDPPLPKNAAGNNLWLLHVPTITEDELNLVSLTENFGKAKKQVMEGNFDLEGLIAMNKYKETNFKFYASSSTCNMEMYKVDFGWGKPGKIIFASPLVRNSILFMDTPSGDSIEAVVSLDEQDMIHFEKDKELLSFASLD